MSNKDNIERIHKCGDKEAIEKEELIEERNIKINNEMYDIEEKIKKVIGKELEEMGITQFNQIQQEIVPELNKGKNIIVECPAHKGISSTVIARSIYLSKSFKDIKEEDIEKTENGGPFIIIICGDYNEVISTREIIKNFVNINVSCWTGVKNKNKEKKGVMRKDGIIVTTLGSILYQIVNNEEFKCPNLEFIGCTSMNKNEDMGIGKDYIKVFNRLPKCQVLLESNKKIDEDIIKSSIKKGIKYKFEEEKKEEQEVGYVLYPLQRKNDIICTIAKNPKKKKIVLKFFSNEEAIFYQDIMSRLNICEGIVLHTKMSIQEQREIIEKINNIEYCVVFTTQERIINKVDMGIFVDIPKDLDKVEYKGAQEMLLMIPNSSKEFIEKIKEKRKVHQYGFEINELINIEEKLKKLVSKQYYVHLEARDAYRRFIQNYNTLKFGNIFQLSKLNLIDIAHTFGLENPTIVNTDLQGAQGVSEVPYEYKRKIFIGKQATLPDFRIKGKSFSKKQTKRKLLKSKQHKDDEVQ
ncbi:ATP-dependent RNA helicase HAS1, putative [Entamoeba dispar SAW760]|uniref:ATP-dependent RNA helicase HAS1, putative n=1 Tax=Entamoeba dispar (strain ATCC PRA-260 / SAW760) TaxID=370354 RepID=B0EPM1_ENTDS|nr:ATP-dependent RNA helicase HAS1, putative [Entamoeba dispar SAW760]EDR23517.1 ATP-dependent RNA helicase HAS1, putative [Entamoeba dispar SAW760]|eukprot:EDR23517.1 ATP-dependent RNA helicase HAS1, putative [Entamoeba dispar SAW760]